VIAAEQEAASKSAPPDAGQRHQYSTTLLDSFTSDGANSFQLILKDFPHNPQGTHSATQAKFLAL
jgi:hypothetical protein